MLSKATRRSNYFKGNRVLLVLCLRRKLNSFRRIILLRRSNSFNFYLADLATVSLRATSNCGKLTTGATFSNYFRAILSFGNSFLRSCVSRVMGKYRQGSAVITFLRDIAISTCQNNCYHLSWAIMGPYRLSTQYSGGRTPRVLRIEGASRGCIRV